MQKNKWLKKADVLLIVALVAICALAIFIVNSSKTKATAYIYQDSSLVHEIDLSQYDSKMDGNVYMLRLDGGVVIMVNGNEIFFHESSCPDKICINAGKLKKSGDTAACLPNKVIVVVK